MPGKLPEKGHMPQSEYLRLEIRRKHGMTIRMKTFLRATLTALIFNPLIAFSAQQCLVIGDSLTKEYEVEFPILYPGNRDAWDSRNWIEILHQERNSWFDLGSWSAYYDYRIVGHKYNWAFPGATTAEIR